MPWPLRSSINYLAKSYFFSQMSDLPTIITTFIRKSCTSLLKSILCPPPQPASHWGGPGLILDWGLTTFDPDRMVRMNSGLPAPRQGCLQSSTDTDRVLKMTLGRVRSILELHLYMCLAYVHTYQHVHVGTYAQRWIHRPRLSIQDLYFWTVILAVNEPTQTTPTIEKVDFWNVIMAVNVLRYPKGIT